MSNQCEYLRIGISPAALECIGKAVELGQPYAGEAFSVQIEIQNFINECRARLQHVAAGDPDTSEDPAPPSKRPKADVPGRSADEDWLS